MIESNENSTDTTKRFTVDLDIDQYTFLTMFRKEHGFTSSIVLRALLYLLEIDPDLAQRVVDYLYDEHADDEG